MYGFLANLIVVIHLAYLAVVLGGLLLILVGIFMRWQWIRNPWFRCIHLAMILFVAYEAIIGYECPLTTWENDLRALAGQDYEEGKSFTVRLMDMVLHPSWANEHTLLISSFVVAGLILAQFIFAPPRFRRRQRAVAGSGPSPSLIVGHGAPADRPSVKG
jgi:hypothetical protein